MQFVFHHTIALLWGKTGIHVETLLRLLERNLRRLRPFLTHYAYLRQLPTTTAPIASTVIKTVHTKSPAGSLCGSCPSSPSAGTTSERERHMEKKSEEEEEEEEAPLGLERQLQEAATVFTKLSLMDALKQLNGMSVEVVPTRLLLHAVVNAFSDVLLIGGGGGQSGVASSVR
ncbi:hypothetical protein DQ04_06861020 [Trypanosoma grayi]|uniref:hypothetical protein n=1 Tax=Trypanosoma grayi TaxID=71804 RepID=UPI0004F40D6C|nr:hypothetical protein DQ04_06861020 [Trypanosoma grayi]KEG08586.1 hypothetical protein DQ04_06861020 [Trypanosoma grayi]